MLSKPWLKFVDSELALLVEIHHERVGFEVLKLQSVAIHAQEGSGNRNRRTFVPVNESLVLRQAFKQCGRLCNNILVIPVLRPGQSSFQRSTVAQPLGTAK